MNKPLLIAFADEAGPRLDEQIAALLRNGMDGIELRNVDGENVSDIRLGCHGDGSPDNLNRWRRAA